jgi:glycerol-3-phosphate acyltransferase PlsX
MRLCVDIMGGDHAPNAILKGCHQALADLAPEDKLVLVGDQDAIKEYFHEQGVKDPRIEIVHTTEVIGMDEHPVEAVRGKKDSSIVVSAACGSSRVEVPCDAVISAGNTGACVSAATMQMKRLPHVHRPGIAVTIPTFHGPVVLCDAGANPEPRPQHLWQYGLMAETIARSVHKKQHVRIAVMNIGAEEAKGTDLIRETNALMKATPGIDYVGYIEGRDLFAGHCDVVVTDGLVGNTLLKMAEGMAKSLIDGIVSEVMNADMDLMLRLEPILKEMFRKNDYHEHGGAPLVGVNGIYIIAHGSSEAKSIRAALKQARKYVQANINAGIVHRLEEVERAMGRVPASA